MDPGPVKRGNASESWRNKSAHRSSKSRTDHAVRKCVKSRVIRAGVVAARIAGGVVGRRRQQWPLVLLRLDLALEPVDSFEQLLLPATSGGRRGRFVGFLVFDDDFDVLHSGRLARQHVRIGGATLLISPFVDFSPSGSAREERDGARSS